MILLDRSKPSKRVRFLVASAGILSSMVLSLPAETLSCEQSFSRVLAFKLGAARASSDSTFGFAVRGLRIPSSIRILGQAGRKGKSTYEDEVRLIESERSFRLAVIGIAALVVILLIAEPLRRLYRKRKRQRSRKRRKDTTM